MATTYRLADIAARIGAELRAGPAVADAGGASVADTEVSALSPLQEAGPGTLSFLASPKYRAHLARTRATAVIVSPSLASECPVAALVVDQPYLAYARASRLFSTAPPAPPGIHPSAVVHKRAVVAPDAHVGPLAVVEEGAEVAAGAVIGAHCHVGAHSRIGPDVRLWPNVTIYHGVTIGARTVVHAGCVIGADGFGFAPDAGRWVKIEQLGGVVIGEDVEIGALTTIDRGAIGDTVIGNGVILDDQVHIAHNVTVGDYTAMAGKSGISGSSKVGRHCLISGMSGLVGHIELCDGVQVSGMTAVTRSISEPGIYTGGTGMMPHAEWTKNAARFRQLDALARRVADLEKKLSNLNGPGKGEESSA